MAETAPTNDAKRKPYSDCEQCDTARDASDDSAQSVQVRASTG